MPWEKSEVMLSVVYDAMRAGSMIQSSSARLIVQFTTVHNNYFTTSSWCTCRRMLNRFRLGKTHDVGSLFPSGVHAKFQLQVKFLSILICLVGV